MAATTTPPKRRFTEAARAAALAARQAKALTPKGDGFEAFIVRGTPGRYTWEIRWFGGVVVEHGGEGFPTLAEALAAGRRALARRAGGSATPLVGPGEPRGSSATVQDA